MLLQPRDLVIRSDAVIQVANILSSECFAAIACSFHTLIACDSYVIDFAYTLLVRRYGTSIIFFLFQASFMSLIRFIVEMPEPVT